MLKNKKISHGNPVLQFLLKIQKFWQNWLIGHDSNRQLELRSCDPFRWAINLSPHQAPGAFDLVNPGRFHLKLSSPQEQCWAYNRNSTSV